MERRTALGLSIFLMTAGMVLQAPAAAPSPRGAVTVAASRADLEELVRQVSREHGVDPRLADALVQVESAYDPWAVSRKGAQGLMQLMPATAARLAVSDPFDPEDNVRGGMREFARLIDRYSGNLALALAAYNAGEGAVERFKGVPPFAETRSYVTRIMTLYTGRSYRLPSYRISPVRMVRDDDGRVVITNHLQSGSGKMKVDRTVPKNGTLRGGFGSR